ncbi:MAG: HAD-IC family P-type ATPase, partial [Sulfolobaceae archaeon]
MSELRIRDEERLKIIGMHCATCVNTVSRAISSIEGVEVIAVNLASGDARIRIVKPVKLKEVVRAIRNSGYDVALEKATISISVNPEDVSKISEKIERIRGVVEARGNPNGIFKVYYNPLSISLNEIMEEIKKFGYNPKLMEKELGAKEVLEREFLESIYKLSVAVIFSFLTFLFQIISIPILSLVFSIPVMIYSASRFYLGAFRALRNRTTNMDVLVFLSSYTAWVFSIIMLFLNGPVIFDAPVLLVTFILAGKTLESYLRARLLRNIISSPLSNIRARKESGEEINAEELKVGDVVVVKAGEIIPCDGIVEEGEGEVDESLFTGESLPVRKVKGDSVLGGSTLISGYLKIYATRTSENTYISQITKTVNEATTVKLNYQRIVDKVSSIFVPVIILTSVITFIIWKFVLNYPLLQSLLFSISVLAVACPCALGLATPMAVASMINKALRRGLLIRRGESLEVLKESRKTIFVFDKTGTVTENKIKVFKYKEIVNNAIEIASAVESLSPHPIAKAISSLSPDSKKMYKIDSFEEFPGYGVYAEVNNM